jgi:transcriptional regulator with GAF, ATPase, and Fis domain
MGIRKGPGEPLGEGSQEVYLVVREGAWWRDIFRLVPGTVVTVGRDAGNRVVLRDDRCSRRQCTFYEEHSTWMIRDLGSRNGTAVNGTRIHDVHPLEEGALIRIGATELLFTSDVAGPLDRPALDDPMPAQKTSPIKLDEDESGEPLVLEGKSQTRFVTESSLAAERSRGAGVREAFATLYRLIVRMMSSASTKGVCETVLKGLLPAVGADIGAVLLFRERTTDRTDPDQLRIVYYCAPQESPYRRVSTKLSARALEKQEAILATGISRKPHPSELGTLQEMEAKSVICAPIRSKDHIHGLLHLYSLQSGRQLDADALDLVLAVGDHLATILDNLDQKESLTASLQHAQDQNTSLRQLLEIESDLIGDSLPMRELRDTIARVAASDVAVLVRGESGVGKELVVRAIHFNSHRSKGPLVCLNCAALTETLLESELFGHEKGAFTGATGRKIGKFEQAHQGTLLLDEVGEMALSTQAKFLRVLEGHSFERVGGNTSVHADVRVVAATNRDLETAVEAGEFRRDLLYRLQVIEVQVRPLREHASDVPALAEHLLGRACQRTGRPRMQFSDAAMEMLRSHDWPGNVRELRNVVERAVVLAEGAEITEADLRFTPRSRAEGPPADGLAGRHDFLSLEEVERLHVVRAMESTNWRKREAARILGINRSTLDRKLEKYDIRPP